MNKHSCFQFLLDIQFLLSKNISWTSRKNKIFATANTRRSFSVLLSDWHSCLSCFAFLPSLKSFLFVVSDVLQFPDSTQNTICTFKSTSTTACRQTEGKCNRKNNPCCHQKTFPKLWETAEILLEAKVLRLKCNQFSASAFLFFFPYRQLPSLHLQPLLNLYEINPLLMSLYKKNMGKNAWKQGGGI